VIFTAEFGSFGVTSKKESYEFLLIFTVCQYKGLLLVPGPETETPLPRRDLLRPTFFPTSICGPFKWSVCKKKLGGLADMGVQNPRRSPKSGLFDISAWILLFFR